MNYFSLHTQELSHYPMSTTQQSVLTYSPDECRSVTDLMANWNIDMTEELS